MSLGIGIGISAVFNGFIIPLTVSGSASWASPTLTFTLTSSNAYAGVEWGVNPTYTYSVFDAAAGTSHTLTLGAADGIVSGTTYIWRPYVTSDPLDAPANRTYGTGGTITTGGVAAPTITGSPTLLASWDFDRADLVTLSGSDITSIAGADGTSYTLTSGASKPTIASRAINAGTARNAARFTSASSQFMQIASACGVSTTNGCTQVIIVEPATTNYTGVIIDIADRTAGATLSRVNVGFRANPDGIGCRRPFGLLATQGTSFTAIPYLVCVTHQGGASGVSSQYINGSSTPNSTTAGALTGTSISHTTLGAAAASSAESLFLNGWVWRSLIYDGALSASQVEEIAVWAALNYNTTNAA